MYIRELVWPPAPGLTRFSSPSPRSVDRAPFGIPLEASAPRRSSPSLPPFHASNTHYPQAFPRRFIDRPQSPAPAILPLGSLENLRKPPRSLLVRSLCLPRPLLSLPFSASFATSVGFVRMKLLRARDALSFPSLRSSIEINFRDDRDDGRCWSSPRSSFFDLRRARYLPPLYARSCWKGLNTDCSLMSLSSLSPSPRGLYRRVKNFRSFPYSASITSRALTLERMHVSVCL